MKLSLGSGAVASMGEALGWARAGQDPGKEAPDFVLLLMSPESQRGDGGGGGGGPVCSEQRTALRCPAASVRAAGCPVPPPLGVSQTESRSCQTLHRVKRGRTNCAILEPG